MKVKVCMAWRYEALFYEVHCYVNERWVHIKTFEDKHRNKAIAYAKDLSKFGYLDQVPPVSLMEIGEE